MKLLEVLKEIRDEVKEVRNEVKATNSRLDGTNVRLDGTNARLESLETRVGGVETRLRFVEKGLENGLNEVTEAVESFAEAQQKREAIVIAEVVSIHTLLRENAGERKRERAVIRDHEKRISALEKRQR